LQAEGIAVNGDELDCSAERFVAAWNTSTADVDRLLAAIARYCANTA
jgi:threonine aldolase